MKHDKNNSRVADVNRRTSRGEPAVPALDAPVPGAGHTGGIAVVSRPGGRHSAITDALYNLQNYKSWAERMKRDLETKNKK